MKITRSKLRQIVRKIIKEHSSSYEREHERKHMANQDDYYEDPPPSENQELVNQAAEFLGQIEEPEGGFYFIDNYWPVLEQLEAEFPGITQKEVGEAMDKFYGSPGI